MGVYLVEGLPEYLQCIIHHFAKILIIKRLVSFRDIWPFSWKKFKVSWTPKKLNIYLSVLSKIFTIGQTLHSLANFLKLPAMNYVSSTEDANS